jgi:hypothetical protein
MRLFAATPASMPLLREIKTALDSVSSDDLRDLVKRIAVPRVFGTPDWSVRAMPLFRSTGSTCRTCRCRRCKRPSPTPSEVTTLRSGTPAFRR